MSRRNRFLISLATLSVTGLLCTTLPAQNTNPAGPNPNSSNFASPDGVYVQAQPAPIERAQGAGAPNAAAPARPMPAADSAFSQPAPGIWLRVGQNGTVSTVASGSSNTIELRVGRGIANITVHHPAEGSQILIDLPGGQVSLLKDGLYTFNAATNTVRVLRGEADAYPGSNHDAKPIKVKEDHAVVFGAAKVRSAEFGPYEARADLLPGPYGGGNNYHGDPAYAPYGPYRYGPYGDGFYGYPYSPYGYPYYGWGYPYGWGWGYPYFGFGFGYYGGFGGFGGFRGRR